MANKNKNYSTKKQELALVAGNSRLHWAWFEGNCLIETWDTPHLSKKIQNNLIPAKFLLPKLIKQNLTLIPIKIASVVPKQTEFWENYASFQVITLKDIKLNNIYATLGIDRALAVWAAGETYNYPCLVIDGGTALTFTGVNKQKELIGGAILPGLRSQFITIKQKTADKPRVELHPKLPPRCASDTKNAIASGIIYTAIAGIYSYIETWLQKYSDSRIILTGGDAEILLEYIAQQYPDLRSKLNCDRNLIFYGINLV
ncbi:MAG: pantothenate kinase [Pleurocapsa sp.]